MCSCRPPAATNIIADTLVARQDLIDQYPDTVRNFVHGWLEGIQRIRQDPNGANDLVGKALKLDADTVSGMLSGLKLTTYADNAQFYGLAGGKAHYETLFDTAFVIWRKKGLVTRAVSAKDWADSRFLLALAGDFPGERVDEPKLAAKAPSASDRAIINKQIQIHFTPGSDEIMAGSFIVLDSLGDTMTSFGNTYLRVEGNTDATGSAAANSDAVAAPLARRDQVHHGELSRQFRGLASRRRGTGRRTPSPPMRRKAAAS